jgi:hypothetical protein
MDSKQVQRELVILKVKRKDVVIKGGFDPNYGHMWLQI